MLEIIGKSFLGTELTRLELLRESGTSDAASASKSSFGRLIRQIASSVLQSSSAPRFLLVSTSKPQLPPKASLTMEVLLGLTGKDFTLIAASKAAMRGATILKASDDKTRVLNEHTLMAFSGEAGDTVQFAEYIQANVALYSMRNETDLSPAAVSSFVRGELAKALRSRKPYTVNLLLGGWSELDKKPSLYWIDYLASAAKVPYAAHGYAQYYCLSILDKHHHPDITFEQGMKILRMCTDELQRRLPIDFKGMVVKAIRKDGIQEIEYDTSKQVLSA